MISRILTFLAGMLAALVLLAGAAVLGAPHLAGWLVVSTEPAPAEAIVVLGGGDGSRLRKGLQLYDQGRASRLVLVDTRKEDWLHIVRRLCTDCELEGKDVTFLEGSTSTRTDAELTLAHLQKTGLKSALVVTSPYHTRRADLQFKAVFKECGIAVQAISTDDFANLLKPDDRWWSDRRTLETVWLEFGKCLYFGMQRLRDSKVAR